MNVKQNEINLEQEYKQREFYYVFEYNGKM